MLKRATHPAAGRANSSLDGSSVTQADSAEAPPHHPAICGRRRAKGAWISPGRTTAATRMGFIVKRRLANEVDFTDIATVGASDEM